MSMEFVSHVGDVFARLDKAADRAKARAGMKVVGNVKGSMKARGPGSKMIIDEETGTASVRTFNRNRQHPGGLPSNPGETPAVQTGQYRATFDYATTPGLSGFLRIGTPDKRGPWLEKGTTHMAPRPHLQPAIEADAGTLATYYAEELMKG